MALVTPLELPVSRLRALHTGTALSAHALAFQQQPRRHAAKPGSPALQLVDMLEALQALQDPSAGKRLGVDGTTEGDAAREPVNVAWCC